MAKLSTWNSRDDCNVGDLLRTNKTVRVVKEGLSRQTPHQRHFREKPRIRIPRIDKGAPIKVVVITDAGEPKDERGYNGKWHGGIAIGLMEDDWHDAGRFAPVYFKSGHVTRVAHSSFDGETLIGIEGIDMGMSVALLVEEFEQGVRMNMWDRKLATLEGIDVTPELTVPIELHTDAQDLVDKVRKITFDPKMAKRRKTDVADFQELEELGIMRPLVKIDGGFNPVDCMTKEMSFDSAPFLRLCQIARDGIYEVYL